MAYVSINPSSVGEEAGPADLIVMCKVVFSLTVCLCTNRRLHESGGSTLEAAAGNDAGEEEAEPGLTAHFLICHVEHLAHPTWDSKAPPSHKTGNFLKCREEKQTTTFKLNCLAIRFNSNKSFEVDQQSSQSSCLTGNNRSKAH